MVKLVAWNIAHRTEPWRQLVESEADIALLQEAAEPPTDIAERVGVDSASWETQGAGLSRPAWRTAVVRLSGDVTVDWLETKSLDEAGREELAVSRLGTVAAAVVSAPSIEPFVAVSMYSLWERVHGSAGVGWIYADASAHRLVSDVAALIGTQTGHRILAAGDLNILYGQGDHGSLYWASRYATVFARMSALGFEFVGPQAPAGRRAHPWPRELPVASGNVPTYYHSRQNPTTATRQLDFVFASKGLAKQVRARALNDVHEWGPSDHCRIEIVIE